VVANRISNRLTIKIDEGIENKNNTETLMVSRNHLFVTIRIFLFEAKGKTCVIDSSRNDKADRFRSQSPLLKRTYCSASARHLLCG
jgi:hypothetical protein